MEPGSELSHPVTVHFYRAVVAHMDVWRQRMDATTNWAAATTAVMVTFTFSTVDSPHFILLLAVAFNAVFLLMESRRYQIFDLWRRRFRALNRHLVAPVLSGSTESDEETREALRQLGIGLGRLIPAVPLHRAVGYRIRRNYGYLFLVALLAWGLKLEVHPSAAGGIRDLMERAAIGTVPGEWVIGGVAAAGLAALTLALQAPSEQMMDWVDVPSPLGRFVSRSRSWTRGGPRDGGGTG